LGIHLGNQYIDVINGNLEKPINFLREGCKLIFTTDEFIIYSPKLSLLSELYPCTDQFNTEFYDQDTVIPKNHIKTISIHNINASKESCLLEIETILPKTKSAPKRCVYRSVLKKSISEDIKTNFNKMDICVLNN